MSDCCWKYLPVRTYDTSSQSRSWGTKKCRRLCYVNIAGVIILITVAVIVMFIMSKIEPENRKTEPSDPEQPLMPSYSKLRKFSKGAVCSDGAPCSVIGRDILAKGGSAVDAAIAVLFCNGLINSQSMGLGGGFLMVVYERKTQQAQALNAREVAPGAVTEELYLKDPRSTREGPLSIAVPGELRGYWAAHQRYGKIPWAELIHPTIKICDDGYSMTKHQFDSLFFRPEVIRNDPLLRETFINASTGEFHRIGSTILLPKLCDTLRKIADEGGDTLYNGSLATLLVQDVQSRGGVITRQDLRNYKVRWSDPIATNLAGGLRVFGVPPPGSGILVAFILKILDGLNFTAQSLDTVNSTILTFHRIIEAFKFAYAKRSYLADTDYVNLSELITNLTSDEYAKFYQMQINDEQTNSNPSHYGGVYFSKDDHGTAHLSVISPDGDAVSATSSINLYFGSGVVSAQTGIILNSGIDDFSFSFDNFFQLPGSPANKLEAGKRSLSSMSPTIVIDKQGDVRLALGASGGTKITTAVSLVIMRHLWFGQDLKTAVDASRFHHQLLPMEVSYEYGILREIVEGLERKGHKMSRYRDRGSIICALSKLGDWIFGNADYRKGGDVYGF